MVEYNVPEIHLSITLPAIDVIGAVNDWIVSASISDYSLSAIDRSIANDFRISHTLYFPREHIPYVEKRLQLAIDKGTKKE